MQIKQKELRKQETSKKETSQIPGEYGESFHRYLLRVRHPLQHRIAGAKSLKSIQPLEQSAYKAEFVSLNSWGYHYIFWVKKQTALYFF